MKCVILAGGLGTRLAEETVRIPKPMVEIGGRPILWHIMKIYATHGVNDFIVCCGYKGYVIKEYFANYYLHGSDVTFDLRNGATEIISNQSEPWRVTLIDTGQDSMTGGRLRRVMPHLEGEEAFCMTYGDGVGNVDVTKLLAFHKSHGKMATVTAVPPAARFGRLDIAGGQVTEFSEKPAGDGGVINGGYFVLSPKVAKYLADDATIWERAPLASLASDGELMAYEHKGFWQPMDTIRERQELEAHWATGKAPWKIW
ncbi:Glucose-1-phosphate cytidylyltransferase [Defluviimonas aquaemixtae]|uniref:Glucose-1-phosphate cytidylyltransferase n=1 Tax=Albidovulum aquaemixtae TaxID=1542388 RepID=A0A2R8B671_9RHOB|nr:glucose-1-phosphate cytidylyltransferase [Defluviimonas aquaemixtae]SPH18094.1 Glucose-1-phosphate cytidylyltransferase [Defluviimonas aquaemixtae]